MNPQYNPCWGTASVLAQRRMADHKQNKQDAYPSPFYYSSEMSLDSSLWLQWYTAPEHWFWPPLILLSLFFPDLTLFLSSSQFPMRTLVEYLGSVFHQSCPFFCDVIIFLCLTTTTLPGCWNCPPSYVGERLLSSPVLNQGRKGLHWWLPVCWELWVTCGIAWP